MFWVQNNINSFFTEILSDLDCQHDTRAYIISIYDKYKSSSPDFSKNSITLLYAEAKFKHNFITYQNLGDWIFFSNTLFGEVNSSFKEYHDTIAQLSYYSCYKLINKQWKLFEELADNFQNIEFQVKNKIHQIKE